MIHENIKRLISYGLDCGLIEKEDVNFTINRILEIMHMDEYKAPEADCEWESLEDILAVFLQHAIEKGLIEDSITQKDLFDTKIMSALMPRPSEVIANFEALYEISPEMATDYYYKLSCDSDYIRRYRIARDIKWVTSNEYGDIDITINLAKPEKDPKAIEIERNAPKSAYPKCMLCVENEGYAGRLNHPARQTHRIIPIKIDGEAWGFQYSPYVYYNEHCIVFNSTHTPMKIDEKAFKKLFDFVKLFPHYFVGSNADLPIVGGSILAHEHFQGGNYEFAMAKAPVEKYFTFEGFEDLEVGIVKWPMSVIRVRGEDTEKIVRLSGKILELWRGYTDEAAFIFANTENTPHNTITPIARKKGDKFEMDLVLRNNIKTPEHPDGLYHPHREIHNIKKENIGLIEVMGRAILPSRLKKELAKLQQFILEGKDIASDAEIAKHAQWFEAFKDNYTFTEENVEKIIRDEVGKSFTKCLEHAGVYKRTADGMAAFERFIAYCQK